MSQRFDKEYVFNLEHSLIRLKGDFITLQERYEKLTREMERMQSGGLKLTREERAQLADALATVLKAGPAFEVSHFRGGCIRQLNRDAGYRYNPEGYSGDDRDFDTAAAVVTAFLDNIEKLPTY